MIVTIVILLIILIVLAIGAYNSYGLGESIGAFIGFGLFLGLIFAFIAGLVDICSSYTIFKKSIDAKNVYVDVSDDNQQKLRLITTDEWLPPLYWSGKFTDKVEIYCQDYGSWSSILGVPGCRSYLKFNRDTLTKKK